MGIYDRDYVRSRPSMPRGGGWGGGAFGGGPSSPGLRGWSVNTWIIVLCVAVFVIDGFLPYSWFEAGSPVPVPGLSEIPDSAEVVGEPRTVPVEFRDARGGGVTRPVDARPIANDAGELVGWQRVIPMKPLRAWLHFSTHELLFHVGFWRLIGFQFLHANLSHLFFNMLGLFFFGPLVEQYLGGKRYLAFYLLCGIFGALTYCLLNLAGTLVSFFVGVDATVPGLLFNDMTTPLIGASAGVFGVLMAGAYRAPNATVLLFFILPMRLKTLAYALVAFAFISVLLGTGNAGGEAGHLGGAIAGWYFIRHPRHLHGFFDLLGRVDPTSHHYRHRGGAATGSRRTGAGGRRGVLGRSMPPREEIDRILDKVHAEGLASLTDREKKILREASERGRG